MGNFSVAGCKSSLRDEAQRGPGIWKLDADGNVSPLAGVALPTAGNNPGVDGLGAAASFGFFSQYGQMCYGADDLLYLNDFAVARTVSMNGAVTTITTPAMTSEQVMACGMAGNMLIRRFDFSHEDLNQGDWYDPIAHESLPGPMTQNGTSDLLYFGPDNHKVLLSQTNSPNPGLVMLNLDDGSSALVAQYANPPALTDLAATPPVMVSHALSGVVTSSTDFDVLTAEGVIRFTLKP